MTGHKSHRLEREGHLDGEQVYWLGHTSERERAQRGEQLDSALPGSILMNNESTILPPPCLGFKVFHCAGVVTRQNSPPLTSG